MKNKLYIGKVQTGKTNKIYEDLKNSKAARKLIIVPDQIKLQTERTAAKQAGGILMLTEVHSFSTLARRLINISGVAGMSPISRIGKTLILKELLVANAGKLKFFSKNTQKYGFIIKLLALLESMEGEITAPSEKLSDKIHDINLIYHAYRNRLEGRYTDDEKLIRLAAEDKDNAGFLPESEVFILGFDFLTQNEILFLKKLCQTCGAVNMAINYQPNNPVYNYTQRLYKSIRGLGEFEEIYFEQKNETWNLEFADSLFALDKKANHGGRVSVYTTHTKEDEILVAVYRIRKLLKSGADPSSISVIAPMLDKYKSSIRRIFSQMEIPFFIDEPMVVSLSPLTQFTRGLLNALTDQGSNSGILDIIRSGIFSGGDNKLTFSYEKFARRHGLNYSNMHSGYIKAQLPEGLEGIHDEMTDMLDFLPMSGQTISEFVESYYDLVIPSVITRLQKHNYRAENAAEIPGFGESEDDKDIGTRIWNDLCGILEELSELCDGSIYNLDELGEILNIAMGQIQIRRLPRFSSYVGVGDVDRTRDHSADHIFVVGAVEGVFPRVFSDLTLFSARERNELAGSVYLTILEDSARERYNLYISVSRARESICFSYPENHEAGRANIISKILETAGIDVERPSISEAASFSTPAIALGHLNETGEYRHLIEEWFASKNYADYLQLKEFEKFDFRLLNFRTNLIGEGPLRLSASSLQDYQRCRFLYYAKRILKLEDEEDEKISMHIGNLVHGVLEKFSNKWFDPQNYSPRTYDIDDREIYIRAAQDSAVFVDEMLEKPELQFLARSNYHIWRLKNISALAVQTVLYHIASGEYTIAGNEIEFEFAPDISGDVIIKGVIDRLDIANIADQAYYRIVDYKTGSYNVGHARLIRGEEIQMGVYMLACRQMYPEARSAGFFINNIRDAQYYTKSISEIKDLYRRNPMKGMPLDNVDVADLSASAEPDSLFEIIDATKHSKEPRLNYPYKNMPEESVYPKEEDEYIYENVKLNADGICALTEMVIEELCDDMREGKVDISFTGSEYSSYNRAYQTLMMVDSFEEITEELETRSDLIDKIREEG